MCKDKDKVLIAQKVFITDTDYEQIKELVEFKKLYTTYKAEQDKLDMLLYDMDMSWTNPDNKRFYKDEWSGDHIVVDLDDDDVKYTGHSTRELTDMLESEYICPDEPVIIRLLTNQQRSTQDVTEFRVTPDAGGTIIELIVP